MAEPEDASYFVDEGRSMAALLHQALAQGIMPDYVSRLLAAFSKGAKAAGISPDKPRSLQIKPVSDHLVEPLSQRELEVLQLVANGASNQDIAEELIIAMTTAKKHVSNIIQKMGVENRTQAAAKGRNIGLCK
jgi:LuxR family maltose regulon positive regulatory protein